MYCPNVAQNKIPRNIVPSDSSPSTKKKCMCEKACIIEEATKTAVKVPAASRAKSSNLSVGFMGGLYTIV